MLSPSGSELVPQFRVTVLPTFTDWSTPALATGALLMVVIFTVSVLFNVPSLTVRLTAYVPDLSATKVGLLVVAPVNVAVLPVGFEVNDQLYVIVLPSGSELPLPFNVTVLPTFTDW